MLFLSEQEQTVAEWRNGAPHRIDEINRISGRSITVGVIGGEGEAAASQLPTAAFAFAQDLGGTVESVLKGDDLCGKIIARFEANTNTQVAMVCILEKQGLISLRLDGQIHFTHSITASSANEMLAEVEKALKHVMRTVRSAGYKILLIADPGEQRSQIEALLSRISGVTPGIPFPDLPSTVTVAAALADLGEIRALPRFNVPATISGFAILAVILACNYALQTRVAATTARADSLAAAADEVLGQALALERLVTDTQEAKVPVNIPENGNLTEWIRLLQFLGQQTPIGVVLDGITANHREARANATSAPYSGMHKGSEQSEPMAPTPEFVIRGQADNLDALALFTRTLDRAGWHVNRVEQVEANTSDTLPIEPLRLSAYSFAVSVARRTVGKR